MHTNLHIKFWVIAFCVAIFAGPLFISPAHQLSRIEREVTSASDVFGYDTATSIVQSSKDAYSVLFIESGILSFADDSLRVSSDDLETSSRIFGGFTKIAQSTNDWLLSSTYAFYGLFIRLGIMWQWCIYMLPLFIAAIVEGMVRRKIKYAGFGFSPPIAYTGALHGIIALLGIPLIYLLIPLPVTPYFMPVWTLILAISLLAFLENFQRLGPTSR